MRIADCKTADCGDALLFFLPTKYGTELFVAVDHDVYADLVAKGAFLFIRSRRNNPCVMVRFPGEPAKALARYILGNPEKKQVHHLLLPTGKACNLINQRSMLVALDHDQHMACHRKAEGERRTAERGAK